MSELQDTEIETNYHIFFFLMVKNYNIFILICIFKINKINNKILRVFIISYLKILNIDCIFEALNIFAFFV